MKTTLKTLVSFLIISTLLLVSSCASKPKNAEAVTNFELNRYLGVWHEIARIDFKHEEGLNNVSAQYTLDDNGNVRVLNSGYNYEKKEWEKAEGWAKFRGHEHIAELKVSFFRPFYSGYNVVAIDENYQYALVVGKDLDYLWILSRSKEVPETVKNEHLALAHKIGYDTSRLLWVTHNRDDYPYLNK